MVNNLSWAHKRVVIKNDVISKASGSCYIEMGDTKVICGVYGPREAGSKGLYSESGRLVVDFKYAPFSLPLWREQRQTAQERDTCRIIEQALSPSVMLDKFPKAVVDIYINVLEADGGEVAAAVSCASLALASAGIQLFDLVGAISVVG